MRIISLLFLCLFALPTIAQQKMTSAQLSTIWERADNEEEQGNFSSAFDLRENFIKLYRENLATLEKEGAGIETLWVLERFLANKYQVQGYHERCIELSRHIVKEAAQYKSRLLAEKLIDLGVSFDALHTTAGRDSAVAYYQYAFDEFKKLGNEEKALITLEKIASNYVLNSKYEAAVSILSENNLLIKTFINSNPSLAYDVLSWKSSAYQHLDYRIPGSREDAIDIETKRADLIRIAKGESSVEYISQLRSLSLCYSMPKDSQIILDLFNRMDELWGNIPYKENYTEYVAFVSTYYTNLCICKHSQNEIDRIANRLDELCQLPTTDFHTCINFYLNRSVELYNKKENEESLNMAHKAERICEAHLEQSEVLERLAQTYTRLSETYFSLGMMAETDEYSNKALDILSKQGNYNLNMANMLNSLSMIKYNIGQTADAKECAKLGLMLKDICAPESISPDDISFYANYCFGEEKIKLVESFESDEFYKTPCAFKLYQIKGNAFYELGDYMKAESFYCQALKSLEENKNSNYFNTPGRYEESVRFIRIDQGHNYIGMGDYAHAINIFESVSEVGDPVAVLNTLYAITRNEDKFLISNEWYSNRIKNELKSHFLFLSEHEREIYTKNRLDGYFNTIESTATFFPKNKKIIENAFNTLLLHKGLVLESARQFNKLNTDNSGNNFVNLNNLRQALVDAGSAEERSALNDKISLLEKKIIKASQQYIDNLFVGKDEVLQSLEEAELAIEFFEFSPTPLWPTKEDRRLGAIILPANGDIQFFDLCRMQQLEKILQKGPHAYNFNGLNEIYDIIWKPIEEHIKGKEKVYFSPIGALNIINIELSASSFLEHPHFCRVSSTRNIPKTKTRQEIHNAILYGDINFNSADVEEYSISNVGTPATAYFQQFEIDSLYRDGANRLPFSEFEVYAVDSLMQKRNITSSILRDTKATEASYKSLSGMECSILHFSTHGFVKGKSAIQDYNDPMRRCGLLLAGAGLTLQGKNSSCTNDGILLGEEISNVELHNNDLIVLSACETGLGSIDSEGVWGLQRAFKKAGGNSILMSLWKVSDVSCPIFMKVFYQNYLSGKDKIVALKLAQKFMREYTDEQGQHPFEAPEHWAAWILLD